MEGRISARVGKSRRANREKNQGRGELQQVPQLQSGSGGNTATQAVGRVPLTPMTVRRTPLEQIEAAEREEEHEYVEASPGFFVLLPTWSLANRPLIRGVFVQYVFSGEGHTTGDHRTGFGQVYWLPEAVSVVRVIFNLRMQSRALREEALNCLGIRADVASLGGPPGPPLPLIRGSHPALWVTFRSHDKRLGQVCQFLAFSRPQLVEVGVTEDYHTIFVTVEVSWPMADAGDGLSPFIPHIPTVAEVTGRRAAFVDSLACSKLDQRGEVHYMKAPVAPTDASGRIQHWGSDRASAPPPASSLPSPAFPAHVEVRLPMMTRTMGAAETIPGILAPHVVPRFRVVLPPVAPPSSPDASTSESPMSPLVEVEEGTPVWSGGTATVSTPDLTPSVSEESTDYMLSTAEESSDASPPELMSFR
jgi:hypothetical protein